MQMIHVADFFFNKLNNNLSFKKEIRVIDGTHKAHFVKLKSAEFHALRFGSVISEKSYCFVSSASTTDSNHRSLKRL